jgi:hypothetical protein
MATTTDTRIIRDLSARIAEIAALPVQQKRLEEWKAINSLQPTRPMFMIDQICWLQMNVNDELTLRCEDEFARNLEDGLRKTLYRWNHIRDDRVFEPVVRVPKVIHGGGYNLKVSQTVLTTDERDSVKSHHYNDLLGTEEDLEKLDMTEAVYDPDATEERLARTTALVGDTLVVKPVGRSLSLALWDRIPEFRGVEKVLYDIIDRPDFIRKTIEKFVFLSTRLVDQLEQQGLLEPAQSTTHCAGGWTDELPAPGFDPAKPKAKDCWVMGMAQMFSTVSPAMHDEFEIRPLLPLYNRFGLVNYGCCEPLDRKIEIVKQLETVRKVSVSPWANEERSAEQLESDYIYLRKPNPAMIAVPIDEELVRNHIRTTLDTCEKYHAIPEFALKDISTVNNDPRNLWRWCEIARELVGG